MNIVKIREKTQLSNPLGEGNALLGHTGRDSDAALEMLMLRGRTPKWSLKDTTKQNCFFLAFTGQPKSPTAEFGVFGRL